nr:immunoglobulin heavy chain junction region [Mus musculus]
CAIVDDGYSWNWFAYW